MEKYATLAYKWFKHESGESVELTGGQEDIFSIIATRGGSVPELRGRLEKRVHCMTYTQYGKSFTVGLGVLSRVVVCPEKWAIVAPTNKKAKIIMGYIIDHIFDNPYIERRFAIGPGESKERIRREKSKEHITFNVGRDKSGKMMLGEVFILSTEGKRKKDVLDALMGFGAANVVLDESSLIDDDQYYGVKRMLGGTKDNFLFEIGNPFRRNHFYRTAKDGLYHHILIDYRQGIREGRITPSFVEEMRGSRQFGILYDVKFPSADAIDSKGYSPLLVEADIERAKIDDFQIIGELRLCVDVAGEGSNFSVITLKGDNGAKVLYREDQPDTMVLSGEVVKFAKLYKILPKNVFIDNIGVGKGTYDRVAEVLNTDTDKVSGTNVGKQPYPDPNDSNEYQNLRAQGFWNAADWIKGGGKLKRQYKNVAGEMIDVPWNDFENVLYKIQSDRKILIKPKKEMLADGIESPDVPDTVMLAFTREKQKKASGWKQKPWQASSEYEGGADTSNSLDAAMG